jgi:hypothetical protein
LSLKTIYTVSISGINLTEEIRMNAYLNNSDQ